MSKQIVVVLTNKAIPYNAVGTLRGMSGVKYADSIYEEAYGAHVARMSLEDYRKAKNDIALGQTRRFNQWSIDFEEVTEGDLIPQETIAQASALLAEVSAATEMVNGENHYVTSPIHTAESLADLKYFALVKVAKQFGIDADKIDGSEPLRKAILEKQAVAA